MVPIYLNGTQTAKSLMQHFNNVEKYARLYTHHCYLLQSINETNKKIPNKGIQTHKIF